MPNSVPPRRPGDPAAAPPPDSETGPTRRSQLAAERRRTWTGSDPRRSQGGGPASPPCDAAPAPRFASAPRSAPSLPPRAATLPGQAGPPASRAGTPGASLLGDALRAANFPPPRDGTSAPAWTSVAPPQSGPAEPGIAAAHPVDARAAGARNMLLAFLKAVRANQLYPRQSRIRKETVAQFCDVLAAHVAAHGVTELIVRPKEILAFGETVYAEGEVQQSISFRLSSAGVRRIRIAPGVGAGEAEGLSEVLTGALAHGVIPEEILASVWERGFEHVLVEVLAGTLAAAASAEDRSAAERGLRDDSTAAAARAEAEATWQELAAAAAQAQRGSDGDPVTLTREERLLLDAAIAGERDRDLAAETAVLFVAALEDPACGDAAIAALRGPFADYFQRLVAAGDLRRAAAALVALRGAAAGSGSPASARALTEVVESLGRTRAVPALGPLLAAAADADPAERQGIGMLLAAIGEPAVAPLCAMLGTASHDEALTALHALAPRHPRPLAAFLSDVRPEFVRVIVALLASSRHPDLAAFLAPALRHADASVRRDALRTLATLRPAGADDLFLSCLDDELYENRATALDALGAARDPRVVAPLLRRIAARSFAEATLYEKREVFRTLGRVATPEATAALARILGTRGFLLARDKHDEMRCLAAAALGLAAEGAANGVVRGILRTHAGDPSEPVRRAVQQAQRLIERRGG